MEKPVLLVSKHYKPTIGGIETAVEQYAGWYRDEGKPVTVLCCSEGKQFLSKRERVDGIDIVRCASWAKWLSVPLSPSFFYYFFLLAPNFAIVHLNLQFPFASLAFFLFNWRIKGKKILTYHCDVYRQRLLKRITYIFDRYTANHVDILLTASPELRDKSEVLSRVRKKAVVVPYAVESLSTVNPAARVEDLIPATFVKDSYDLFFGRLVTYKGTEIVHAAAERILCEDKDWRLVVFGEGPEAFRFRDLQRRFPKRVFFIEQFLNQDQKIALIISSRTVLFPSIYNSESFGIAQIEAMVHSKPIINTFLDNGVNWVAAHMEGAYTIPKGSPDELVRAIRYLNANSEIRESIGEAGHKRVLAFFSEDRVRAQFISAVNR